LALITGVTTVLLLLVIALFGGEGEGEDSSTESPHYLFMALFWLAAGVEFFCEAIMTRLLHGHQLVPVSIEQTTERMGAMELVCIGETLGGSGGREIFLYPCDSKPKSGMFSTIGVDYY
jgi:hypothetical protein